MSAESSVVVQRLPRVVVVRIEGAIDESFDPAALAEIAGNQVPIVIDLDAAVRITSFGIREWLLAFEPLAARDLYFVRARPALVAQFNTVARFDAGGRLLSFYCPAQCAKCGHVCEVLVEARTAPPSTTPCPKCASPAELDELAATFFEQHGARATTSIPAAVESVAGIRTAAPLRVRKDVEGNLTALWLFGRLDATARLKRQADGLEGDVLVLLGGVIDVDDAGIARFDEVAGVRGARVFLARVPLAIARKLAARPEASRAQFLSLHAIATCSACDATLDVDVTPLARGGAEFLRCAACGARYAGDAFGEVAPLMRLPFCEPTPAMRAYLESWPEEEVDEHTPPRSQRQIGDYEIIRPIGVGGMAEVLLGRRIGLEGFEKRVVVKRILPHLAEQPAFVQLFLDEARVAARLTHPHVAQIFDLGHDGENYFIVMEYIDGADFNTAIKMARRLGRDIPVGLCARVIAGMCAGLDAAHSHKDDDGRPRPILHRDVSPHNLLLGVNGAVKITDFGIAKASTSLEAKFTASVLRGKLPYMAPEYIQDGSGDHRIDIFAAGLSLYFALTKRQPFYKSGGDAAIFKAVLDGQVAPPSASRRDIPPALDEIVMRAIAHDPADRFPSARAMQLELEGFLVDSSLSASFADVAEWLSRLRAEHAARPSPRAAAARIDTLPTERDAAVEFARARKPQ